MTVYTISKIYHIVKKKSRKQSQKVLDKIVKFHYILDVELKKGGAVKNPRQFFSAFALISLFLVSFCYAGWLSPEWRCRRAVEIGNPENDTALTEYAVKLEVVSNKQFRSDFADLRFTDANGEDELNYWVEKFTPGISAIVWVKVPLIPPHSSTVIYMYYGNSKAASKSDGRKTFLFYDDFNDCNIDDWNIISGSWHANNCFLEQTVYANRLKILSSYEITKPVIVKAKLNHISGNPYFAIHIMFSKDSYCGNGYYFGYGGINRGGTMISKITDSNVVQLVTDSTIQNCMYPNEWLDITIYFKGNEIYNLFLKAPDGKQVSLELHDNTFHKPYTLGLWVGDHIGCDDIIVYKYTGHPPKFSFGDEEENPWYSPIDNVQNKDILHYPNPFKINNGILFVTPLSGYVTVSVYDISGRLISRPLSNIYLSKGEHSVYLSSENSMRTGVYFLHFQVKGGSEIISVTDKVTFLR